MISSTPWRPWMYATAAALFGILWFLSGIVSGSPLANDQASVSTCIFVKDATRKQHVLIETWGDNAVRVRTVPEAGAIRNDLVSALVKDSRKERIAAPSVSNGNGCAEAELLRNDDYDDMGRLISLKSGNLRASLTADGILEFANIAEDKIILRETKARQFFSSSHNNHPSHTNFTFHGLEVIWDSPPEERLYGLGQHKLDALDYKKLAPLDLNLAPRNTEILIPVVHSSRKYVCLMNLPSFGNVSINKESVHWAFGTVVQFDMWIATTSADDTSSTVSPWAQLQASYADATGYPPVYPYFTTGFWQSKNRYRNQTQLLDVARGYIERGYPLALMVIDYHSWDDPSGRTYLGDELLAKPCWPDPKAMVKELQDMGVELMISPYFHSLSQKSRFYEPAESQKLLATNSSGQPVMSGFSDAFIYDLYQPASRKFAWEAVENGYIRQYGMHQNWWVDCNEPCYARDTEIFEQEMVYNRGNWPASFVGAAYPHFVSKMVWEGQRRPDLRENSPVMLARSAWAGSQRFGVSVWSGDTSSNFNSLRQQVRAGLNMAMSGIPYWTTDIGGYQGGNIDDYSFRQLIVRWFQFGAFSPFFRNHGRRGANHIDAADECGSTNGSNEIWNFGQEAEEFIAIMMRIREQLRPYVMEQYRAASERAEPIIRPLFYDFWKEDDAAAVEDQFMFGPDYMIAPQLFENATNRTVYLPPGELWVDYFSDGPYIYDTTNKTKGIRVVIPTPLEKFPVFIRAPLHEGENHLDVLQLLRGNRVGVQSPQ